MGQRLCAGAAVGMLGLACISASFAQGAGPSAITPQAAFERLKQLTGEWNGTVQEKENGPAASVRYRVTANGSAVVEILFPDTAHEMMTVYHMDGERLILTHYCAVGNQPRMVLDPASTHQLLVFTFAGGTNMKSEKDLHMHSGRIRLVDDATIESEWDVYRDGDKVDTNRFFLSRDR